MKETVTPNHPMCRCNENVKKTNRKYTHCPTFELPGGKVIEIPPPPVGDGWKNKATVEYDWPHEYISTLTKTTYKIQHTTGQIIYWEYEKQLRAENARIVKIDAWECDVSVLLK